MDVLKILGPFQFVRADLPAPHADLAHPQAVQDLPAIAEEIDTSFWLCFQLGPCVPEKIFEMSC